MGKFQLSHDAFIKHLQYFFFFVSLSVEVWNVSTNFSVQLKNSSLSFIFFGTKETAVIRQRIK